MTRIARILGIVVVAALVTAAPAAAGHGGSSTGSCSISVDRHVGGPSSGFRMHGEGWPAGTLESLTIVEIRINRVGTHSGSLAWLWLVPGGTWFIYDFNTSIDPNEPPADPLAPGTYRIRAQAEGYGCVARDWFVIRYFGRVLLPT